MASPDLAKPIPRILITNDDGYRAEGLRLLEQVALELSDDVWVVAPEHDQSGTSHSVSLQQPLRLYTLDERHHSASGTPSDCVLLAVEHLMRGRPPSVILSGINCGANLSDSVAYSGTVGAAMTAILLGIPAIALSQAFRRREQVRWDTSARLAPPLIRELVTGGWPGDLCMSINFPDEPVERIEGVEFSRQGRGSISGVRVEVREDTRGLPYYWIGFRRATERVQEPASDVAVLRRRRVSVTPLRFDKNLNGDWSAVEQRLARSIVNA